MRKWILQDRVPVPCDDLLEFARWFEQADRHIALTYLGDGVTVSTVFLGMDHNFGDGPPLLFETMCFGSSLNEEQRRYSTYDEAEIGHAVMVRRVRESLLRKVE